jgi:hypothetical protein
LNLKLPFAPVPQFRLLVNDESKKLLGKKKKEEKSMLPSLIQIIQASSSPLLPWS